MNAGLSKSYSAGARSHSGIDLILVFSSFVVCHKAYLKILDFTSERLIVLATALLLTYVIFTAAGVYRTKRSPLLHQIVGRLTIAWGAVVLMVGLVAFFSKTEYGVSRVWFTLSVVLSYVLLLTFRLISGYLVAKSRRRGEETIAVAIVGINELTRDTIQRIAENPWAGYRIVGVFGSQANAEKYLDDASHYAGEIESLLNYIEEARHSGNPIAQVWIVLPLAREREIREISDDLRASSVDICLVPDTFGMQVLTGSLTNVAELTVVNFSDIRLRGIAELYKRIFDGITAACALVCLSPLLLMISMAIKLDSRGPVLFKQRRYGMDGREIVVWKFRSMFVAEDGESIKQATRNDVRVTNVGAFLRRYSLDELPQFFNVLQGSMSIVGPRPHAVSHNEEYRHKIDGYMMRHKIKPGITGWAQVNGWRGETDTLEKMEKRVFYDLEYIRNWSAWLDAKIILLTIVHVFSGREVY